MTTVCDVAVAGLLYILLRPVNRPIAVVDGFFRLAYAAPMAVASAFLAALLSAAGACYVFNTLANFVAPAVAAWLDPWVLLPGFVAEGGLTLWLLLAGVNVARWQSEAMLATPA